MRALPCVYTYAPGMDLLVPTSVHQRPLDPWSSPSAVQVDLRLVSCRIRRTERPMDSEKAKSPYGSWNRERSILEDADVSNEIAIHLQSIGKYVKALDIVHYLDRPEVRRRLGLKKGIHLATAQRWMKRMGYRWTKNPSGQYVDGHERPDVVYYRQTEYIPAFTELEHQTRKWTLENLEIIGQPLGPPHRETGTAQEG
ncbi:hypothetical protein B0H12DRAFT_1161324 [Mycena haematopus]|nr:hypothetical protein B0H12DRAFT_1161324 [Mycena haematopus]